MKNKFLRMKYKKAFWILLLSAGVFFANAQTNLLYENLPVGKYAVGFKIITLTDDSRVAKPEFNYLGEKNEGDRRKKFSIHIWYPAQSNSGKRILTYGDYCYSHRLTNTTEVPDKEKMDQHLVRTRAAVERWFGKTSDGNWEKLMSTKMLASVEAVAVKNKFPLLIGDLRSLSTTIVNEMLASNGYIVCMVNDDGPGSFADGALQMIPNFQLAIDYLGKNENADLSQIGTFGFSGSGFIQVLFAMFDVRVKALADIESGIYMDHLFQSLSASNFYKPSKLRVPFLHIFSRDLSKEEIYIDEFERKTNFSKRYRLLLNQPKLHHWDFAAEGYTAALMLDNRGTASANIAQTFQIASTYLLNFFNAVLKSDAQSNAFLLNKPQLPKTDPTLWDISMRLAATPAPDENELQYIIQKKGINEAMRIVNNTIQTDSSASIRTGYVLNGIGYGYLNEKKYEEALAIFNLNMSLHPTEANWFDSMAEACERSGDFSKMKIVSQQILDLLNRKTDLSNEEKSLRDTAQKRLKK